MILYIIFSFAVLWLLLKENVPYRHRMRVLVTGGILIVLPPAVFNLYILSCAPFYAAVTAIPLCLYLHMHVVSSYVKAEEKEVMGRCMIKLAVIHCMSAATVWSFLL